jgi:hypothetical protein
MNLNRPQSLSDRRGEVTEDNQAGAGLKADFFFLRLDSPKWAWASSFRRGFMITHI